MKKYEYFTTNEIKPRGWIKSQLSIQANGLSGNLDKVWRDVRDSAWIGGDAEGWERVPYWLDGFIPLAYLLEDGDMIARAKKYIDAIISHQKQDGWLCPCEDEKRAQYDTWALLLISKVLTVYYECSNDERIPSVLYKAMKNFYTLLKSGEIKLFDWGKYRWFEGFFALELLYKAYGEEWIKELGLILKSQGKDYREIESRWVRPMNEWTLDTHIVNLCMMIKSEAVSFSLLGEEYEDLAEHFYSLLYKYNGMPAGIFTGDEVLSGISAIQGAELCSVVELMFCFEQLYARTGDKKWAELLELVAFNALPATLSDDMWSHQYDQQTNQIACIRFKGKPIFRTNFYDSHLFGLEPNYGCCTANFSQGWPKLALSAFMQSENDIISALALPCELNCETAHIILETDYPFKNSFKYRVSAKKDFRLGIRIPSFAKNLLADGKQAEGDMLYFSFKSGEQREICISFTAKPHIEPRPFGLNVAKYGSLLFALPIKYRKNMLEYERDGVERKFPYCDYEYIPESDFGYGFAARELSVVENELSPIPFSSQQPPLTLKASVAKIDWGFEDGYDTVCAKIPNSREPLSPPNEVLLYPYGCAKLRMTELPFIE
ncbi:MAG: glycoside hydrolase family 127 protein [Clostridia bacterium]|nr:glycoside hydrolase family 127 protein [Clostridia bacterium]